MTETRSETMENLIGDALRIEIRQRAEKIAREEIEKAKCMIEKEVCKVADAMAINILSFYSITRRGEEVIITVKKQEH